MSDDEHASGRNTDLVALGGFVERLTQLVQKGGLTSLEIKTDDVKIKIRSDDIGCAPVPAPVVAAMAQTAGDDALPDLTGSVVTAPMVGTFYHSTSPAEPPLVEVGDRIEVGQVIGIIEAMKIMNEISSDRNGLVVEIVAANGAAVEYGSPLLRVVP
jgi:acetyl-CoA carboxylase biotin carboxyl carrier protein